MSAPVTPIVGVRIAGADTAAARALDAAGATFVVVSGDDAVEPFTLAAHLLHAVPGIAVVLDAPTHGDEPYHVARRLASLDHLSGGRVGWLLADELPGDRAAEFVEVVRSLWDSWDDDAFVRDTVAGHYYDPAHLHPPHHLGRHFRVRGPLNISRPPQGHPPLLVDTRVVLGTLAPLADVVVVDPGRAVPRSTEAVVLRAANAIAAAPADARSAGVLLDSGTSTAEASVRSLVPGTVQRAATLRRRLGLERPAPLRRASGVAV